MSAILQPHPGSEQVTPPLTPVPAPPQRGPWKPILIALVVLGIVGWLIARITPRPEPALRPAAALPIRTAKLARGTLELTMRIGGQTAARNYSQIIAPILRGPESHRDLTIMKMAKPGSRVKKGDVLAVLDPTNARDHIDDVTDTVTQAATDIRKRKFEQEVDRENLQQNLRVAKAELDKAKLDAGAAEVKTIIERELLQLSAEEAEARYKQLQLDVPWTKAEHGAELRVLEITEQRQRNHLNRHTTDIKKYDIRAAMDGLMVALQIWRGGEMGQVQEGDQVYPGQPFLKVVDTATMQVEGNVNQAESGALRIGQPVTVGLDAFPDLRFKGRVYSIGALAVGGWRSTYYIRTIPVRITIESDDPHIIPDLSAWGNVVLDRAENVVVTPNEAIRQEGGESVVYVKNGGRFVKRAVRTGLHNETHTAVLAGLEAGDVVALEPPRSIL